MDPGWRRNQAEHDRRARERLAKGGGERFRDREATMTFCKIMIALDGYAEARGLPTPKNHKAGRAIVERHLPLLADFYDELYALSPDARCYNGYAMTERGGGEAARCREALAGGIPAP